MSDIDIGRKIKVHASRKHKITQYFLTQNIL